MIIEWNNHLFSADEERYPQRAEGRGVLELSSGRGFDGRGRLAGFGARPAVGRGA